jgi:hypothetical protein
MSISSVLSDLYLMLAHSLALSKIEDSRIIGGVGVAPNVVALHSFQMDQHIKKTMELKPARAILATDFRSRSC